MDTLINWGASIADLREVAKDLTDTADELDGTDPDEPEPPRIILPGQPLPDPGPNELVRGIWKKQGINLIFGQPSIGKTIWALKEAVALATECQAFVLSWCPDYGDRNQRHFLETLGYGSGQLSPVGIFEDSEAPTLDHPALDPSHPISQEADRYPIKILLLDLFLDFLPELRLSDPASIIRWMAWTKARLCANGWTVIGTSHRSETQNAIGHMAFFGKTDQAIFIDPVEGDPKSIEIKASRRTSSAFCDTWTHPWIDTEAAMQRTKQRKGADRGPTKGQLAADWLLAHPEHLKPSTHDGKPASTELIKAAADSDKEDPSAQGISLTIWKDARRALSKG